MLPNISLFRGSTLGAAGYSHPHVNVGVKHTFSLWLKRPRSTSGIVESVAEDFVIGSYVMRGPDSAWKEKNKHGEESDGGLGNIGLVVEITPATEKDKKKSNKAAVSGKNLITGSGFSGSILT